MPSTDKEVIYKLTVDAQKAIDAYELVQVQIAIARLVAFAVRNQDDEMLLAVQVLEDYLDKNYEKSHTNGND